LGYQNPQNQRRAAIFKNFGMPKLLRRESVANLFATRCKQFRVKGCF